MLKSFLKIIASLFLFILGFVLNSVIDRNFVTINSFQVPAHYSNVEVSSSRSLICNELFTSSVSEKELRSNDTNMVSTEIQKTKNHGEKMIVNKLEEGFKLVFENSQQEIMIDDFEQNNYLLYLQFQQRVSDVAYNRNTLVINKLTGYAINSRVSSIQRQGEIIEAHQTLFNCK